MRRTIVYGTAAGFLLAFMFGLVVGVGGTDDHDPSAVGQSEFDRGYAQATKEMQEDAVRNGHAAWSRRVDGRLPNDFTWLPARTLWNGDRAEVGIGY